MKMIFIEIRQGSSKTYLNLAEICAIREMDGGTRICMNNGKIFDTEESIEEVSSRVKSAMDL